MRYVKAYFSAAGRGFGFFGALYMGLKTAVDPLAVYAIYLCLTTGIAGVIGEVLNQYE